MTEIVIPEQDEDEAYERARQQRDDNEADLEAEENERRLQQINDEERT